MKKHIPPFLLAAWPYLLLVLLLPLSPILEEAGESAQYDLLVTCLSAAFQLFMAALFICNVVYALRSKQLTALELARWDFIIKLCHTPVYVLLFLFALLMLIAIAVPAVLMMVIVMIPTIFLLDLFLMLTSSCYGFRALRMAKQEGLADKKWARRMCLAHCFFVADVISAFFVWRRLKKETQSRT